MVNLVLTIGKLQHSTIISEYTCNSCNTGMRAFPDMHAGLPEGRRPEGRGRTFQAKPECSVLQLICNTLHG